jgi:tetratricopeptide (TPR) repeat protein
VTEALDRRLASLRDSGDVEALVDLGCDLSDAGRHVDAERCFARAVDLGKESMCLNLGNALYDQGRYDDAAEAFARAALAGDGDAWINLGNSLTAAGRLEESVGAFESATAAGDVDAWLNLGMALEELGDLAGALRAYESGAGAGDANATVAWAFMQREQGEQAQAERIMALAVGQGSGYAAAVLATWRWDRTADDGLEPALRAGAGLYPSARAALGELLRVAGRLEEAVAVLSEGLALGEAASAIPLGNIHADDLCDPGAAAEAYRQGIALGDAYSHHNLAGLLEDEDRQEEAINHYRMAAAEGDHLAARALRRLSDDT